MSEIKRKSINRLGLILISLSILIIFSVSIIYLDFRVATSETKINSQVSTAASNNSKIDLTGNLYFFVEEDEGLSEVLKSRLSETLQGNGIEIKDIETLEKKYHGKILMLAILKQDVSYNPFFPSANLNILFSYSSNGNTSYFEAQKRGEHPVFILEHTELFIQGQQQLTDDTGGIISRRAYHNYLANQVVKDILLKLKSGNNE